MKAIKSILKWLGIIVLIILIFAIAAPFIFKDKIVALVKEEANKNLNARIDFGDFSFSLLSSFPNFSLSIDNVSVANIGEFEGDTLFSAKNLSSTIDLMSVIKGEQYKIRSVVLNSPRIKAIVLSNGKANWDIAKTDSTQSATESAEPTKFKMSLKNLEIKDAHIIYDDATLSVYTLLDHFNYTLSGDFTQDNFEMMNEVNIGALTVKYGGIAYLNQVKTTAKAAIDADMPKFKFTFKENEISLNELGIGIDGTFAMPGEDIDMDMKLKAQQTDFKNILSLVPSVYTKDFATVKTKGKFALDAFVKGVYNDKKMPAFGANIKIDDAMFQYPSLPKSVNDITIDVSVKNADGEPDHTITDIKKFHMEMAGNPIDIAMHIETPVSDPYIQGTIIGKINLTSIKDIVPMEDSNLTGNITADLNLKGKMSSIEKEKYDDFDMNGSITVMDMNYKSIDLPQGMSIKSMAMNFSPQFVELKGFDGKIGKSDIQANGMIENILQYALKDSVLQGTFSMKSNLMDLNEFMAEDETTASAAAADTAPLSILEVPQNIDFIMNSNISKMMYDDIEIRDLSGSIIIRDSKATMNKVKMSLLGGAMTMGGTYSTVNPKVPTVDFELNINEFDIAQTFEKINTAQKLAPIGKHTSGKFSTQLKYSSNLDEHMMPVLKTMNGDGTLQTKKVLISNFKPLNQLADALGGMDKFRKTEFSDLDLSYHIKDGKISTDDFQFKSGSIMGTIFGSVSIDQIIDYTMKMNIPTSEIPGGAQAFISKQFASINKLGMNIKLPENINVKALFGGTVTNPTVKADFSDMKVKAKEVIKEEVKEVIKQQVTAVKEDLSKKLEEQKKKIMEDAQAQADKIRTESKKLAAETQKAGYAQADNLEKEAKNPVAKVAAKKAAEKIRKEIDEKAKGIEAEGNKKADSILKSAQEQADKIK